MREHIQGQKPANLKLTSDPSVGLGFLPPSSTTTLSLYPTCFIANKQPEFRGQDNKTMTDNDNISQIIHCTICKTSITIDELGEHVNANSEVKKGAVQEQLQLWDDAYDKAYLIQNVVFCPVR